MAVLTARETQEWLTLHGFPCGTIDGAVGKQTRGATAAFQASQGLPVTGIVDAATSTALVAPLTRARALPFNAAPRTRRDVMVALASRHVREHPREVGGQNRGPWVRAYASDHEGDAIAWCGYWLRFLAEQGAMWTGGADMLDVWSPSCDDMAARAKRLNRLVAGSRLQPGDVFLVGDPRDFYHTGLITGRATDGGWLTAEANTNYDGSRNGIECIGRLRDPTEWGILLS